MAINSDNASDIIFGGTGGDLIIGQYGNDYLYGEDGNDILWGDDNKDPSIVGNDTLDGGSGDDWLIGGGGNDILRAGTGKDTLDGGAGFDIYDFKLSDLLSTNDIKTITDSDGDGAIWINGANLTQNTWTQDTLAKQLYQDGQGNSLTQVSDAQYLLQSNNFTGTIHIHATPSADGKVLGMTLSQANQAPQILNQQQDQNILAGQAFNISLSQDLFTDPDGDVLEYMVVPTVAVDNFHFDKNTLTLTGVAPASGKLSFDITATDPKGLSATQAFTLTVNEAPTLTN